MGRTCDQVCNHYMANLASPSRLPNCFIIKNLGNFPCWGELVLNLLATAFQTVPEVSLRILLGVAQCENLIGLPSKLLTLHFSNPI